MKLDIFPMRPIVLLPGTSCRFLKISARSPALWITRDTGITPPEGRIPTLSLWGSKTQVVT
jgi:hypothetical protein